MIGVGSKTKKVPSSVADFLDCPNLEGLLKKKNSHGQWKDRYCQFHNGFFMTYKPKGNKASNEIKESIDLKDVEGFSLRDDALHLEMKTGETLLYKGSRLKEWMDSMRLRSSRSHQLFQKSLAENASKGIHISGWLSKKSHNKYHGFQERYVKVEGHVLKYYKRDVDTTEVGSTNLVATDFIRPYDDTADCTIFEVKEEDRVFIFQANSNKEMLHWISTLEKVRISAQAKIQEELQDKLVKETPERIRQYDEMGEEKFRGKICEDLCKIYPDPANPPDRDSEFTIKDHIDSATKVVKYLQSLVPEVQKCAQRPARYDVLALAMTVVNSFLYDRMSTFLIVSTADANRITKKRKKSNDHADSGEDGSSDEEKLVGQHRSDLIEGANLGDLHAIIDWIAKYQITIKKIRCPVATGGKEGTLQTSTIPASSSQAILSTTYLNPKQSRLFELLPDVCRLYVYGGSKASKGGAASHLYDHCIKVWESVVNNPEEMLQRNNDGSFYTHAPVDMWEAINQHISLATATNSPILHVMIADKVVSTLIEVFDIIINYVNTLDTSNKSELREIELEYISALANDTALHIEEVIELIDNFTITEIRERIDEIFDPLTTNLVKCGEVCLKRLAGLVMSDVQGLLDQVFMPEWMEGNQMHVATATISDYMTDFEEYLVEFWADKFVYTILEEVILSYTRSLLFHKNRPPKTVTTTVKTDDSSQPKSGGFLSSFFQKTKQTITQTITTIVPSHVPVDEESLGRLAQDVNILNAFFSKKAGQETATEFLALMNEISLLLFLDMAGLLQHFTVRTTEFPSAAQAIYEVVHAVMKMRVDDFTKSDFEFFTNTTQSLLISAIQEAKEKELNGIVEGRLGLLYIEVVPKEIFNAPQRITLAQRMKMMSNIPIFGKSTIKKSDSEELGEDEIDKLEENDPDKNDATNEERAAIEKSNQLLDDVMEVLQQQDLADETYVEEEERAKQEEEAMREKIGLLTYEGHLEKKSPAHNLWQKRFFKFVSRETQSAEKPYLYQLMWFKKQGGSVIKGLEIDKIQSVAVICSNRSLSYCLPPRITSLVLQSEAGNSRDVIQVLPLEHEDNNAGKQGGMDYFIFRILQTDGKDHVLRSSKIDRIMRWINTIATAGSLAYDPKVKQWTRMAFTYYEEQAAERAKLTSFQTVSVTPLPSLVSTGKSSSTSSTDNHNNQLFLVTSSPSPKQSNEIDVKSAAALLQSLKDSTGTQPTAVASLRTDLEDNDDDSSAGAASDSEEESLQTPTKPYQSTPSSVSNIIEQHPTAAPITPAVVVESRNPILTAETRSQSSEAPESDLANTLPGSKRQNRGGRGGNRYKPPPPPADPTTISSNINDSIDPSTKTAVLKGENEEETISIQKDGSGSIESSPKPTQRRSINMKRVANNRALVARTSITGASAIDNSTLSVEAIRHDHPHHPSSDEGTSSVKSNGAGEDNADSGTTSNLATTTKLPSVDSDDNSMSRSLQSGSHSPKSSLKSKDRDRDRDRSTSRASLRVSFAEKVASSDEGRTIHSFEVEEPGQDNVRLLKQNKKRGCADSCVLL